MKIALIARSLALVLVGCSGCSAEGAVPPREEIGTTAAALDAVSGFGSNPGNLLMYRHVPDGMPSSKSPLVVVLHGCTQSADAIANAGWNAMADKYKFYVAYPQQQSANNPVTCFDWWGKYNQPADKTNITRGGGENMSIKQMVDKMKSDYAIDDARVFVAGFSSGAAMTAVMLAAWPDVFAAGGIAAGVAYDCPSTTNSDVWTCMSPGKTLAADDWGGRVRAADQGFSGPFPRVSIWQGTQDTTVAVANETELVKQWTNVHGISATPTTSDTVDGYPHDVFADGSGRAMVERWAITGMSHGFAIDAAHGCGTAGAYVYDEHVCTPERMLQFFGIADATGDGGAPPSGGDGGASGGGSGGGNGAGGGHLDASSGGCSVSPADAGNGAWGAGPHACALSRGARGGRVPLALLALFAFAMARRARRRGTS